ncbi:hypothetical protein E2C01_027772 [Portunus trituberculatus]|uniref:Uncharacterized protein n=1 Tax=Portunus trituberculatus TaxID=210409 RepID=A0A5B7EMF8_PORTR|nr:hypothetical protein [Portunus trituberculatus]
MKIAVEDSKRFNILAVKKRLKGVRGDKLRRKAFDSTLHNRTV